MNGLKLAAWSPGLGSALQGEFCSIWHFSRPGGRHTQPDHWPDSRTGLRLLMRRSEPKHEGVTGQSWCDFRLFDVCSLRMWRETLIGQFGVTDRTSSPRDTISPEDSSYWRVFGQPQKSTLENCPISVICWFACYWVLIQGEIVRFWFAHGDILMLGLATASVQPLGLRAGVEF